MIHKKGNQFTFFESLARLAYNKGTALFRGNDPLQRSAAATFSLIFNTSSYTPNMLDMVQTGMETEKWQSHSCPTDEHINQEGFLFLQKRILCYQPIHRQKVTCTCESHCIAIKLLKKLNCGVSSRKSTTALSQKGVWWGSERVRQASLSALLSERPTVVAASVGVTYKTKQSETTQNVIHKGPVCRQQAELGHRILLVAKTRKCSM